MSHVADLALHRFDHPRDFARVVEPFLCQREAEHNLMLGLTGALQDNFAGIHGLYMTAVEQAGEVVAAALRTDAAHEVLISCAAPVDAVEAIAQDIYAVDAHLKGITSDTDGARVFIERWSALTGQAYHRNLAMRIYKLEHVHFPDGVPGSMRPAQLGDRALLVDWVLAFMREAVEPVSRIEAMKAVDARLLAHPADAGWRIWADDDGHTVSIAGYSGRTPNGIRVGYVYTPPERRGRGYASACVAALSQEMLDEGYQFCFLFTDLLNPTSNHIYQQIGYEPVSDVDQYRFGEG